MSARITTNSEAMMVTSGVTPLGMNLESLTAEPIAVPWIIEKASHNNLSSNDSLQNFHRRSVDKILWNIILIKGLLATSAVRESWRHDRETQSGWGSKDYLPWKIENTMCCAINVGKVAKDPSLNYEEEAQPVESWLIRVVAKPFHES